MKVFVLRPNEDWIVDRFANEFENAFPNLITHDPRSADVVWLMADWAYDQIPYDLLKKKRVLTTVHHIFNEKFSSNEQKRFHHRDNITHMYHVPCNVTKQIVLQYSTRPVVSCPFWLDSKFWIRQHSLIEARNLCKLPTNAYIVGSFQRDTEGIDLKSPKLEKGPDLLCDALEKMWHKNKSLFVVLAGWRRQYVVNRLSTAGIPFAYFERPDATVVRDLYCALDLYLVTARVEGGPMAITECAALKTPIVSTPVGQSLEILAPESIGKDVTMLLPNVDFARKNVENIMTPMGFFPFIELIRRVAQ